jgi:hypothetical protein
MDLSGKLKHLLAESKIKTWRQVDGLARLPKGSTNNLAHGKGSPRLDRAAAVARVFGASLDWLADDSLGPPAVKVGPGLAFLLRLTEAERAAFARYVAAHDLDAALADAVRLLCAADAAQPVTPVADGADRRHAARRGAARGDAPAVPPPGQRRNQSGRRSA